MVSLDLKPCEEPCSESAFVYDENKVSQVL